MESKDLLDLCQKANIDVKNQLSSLDPEQRDLLVEMVRKVTTARAEPPKPVQPQKLPDVSKPVPTLESRRPTPLVRDSRPPEPPPAPEQRPAATAPPAVVTPPPPPVEAPAPVVKAPVVKAPVPPPAEKPAPAAATPPPPKPPEAPAVKAPAAEGPPTQQPPTPSRPPEAPTVRPPLAPAARAPEQQPQRPAAGPQSPPPTSQPPTVAQPRTPPPPSRHAGPMRNLGGGRREGDGGRPKPRPQTAHGYQMAKPPTPRTPPKPPESQKPAAPAPTGPRRIGEIPRDFVAGDKPIRIEDLLRPPARPPATPAAPVVPEVPDDDESEADRNKKKKPGGVVGRDARHKARNEKAKGRDDRLVVGKGGVLVEPEIDRQRTGDRLKRKRQKVQPGTVARKGKVPIELPITVRSLSAAMGTQAGKLLKLLMDHGAPATININSMLDPDLAEALALEQGCELDIKRPVDLEEQVKETQSKPDAPEDLKPRAPVVTIMGHVDHGKTSLLDKIRHSNVVATEAGGITQSIRAWRVEHGGRPITFLDTPGHEAFTKMRARGANVTDIAVIVVAADDGVMPQTEEAISHAKAAGVSIVVAINKVDLPNANLRRTEQQLYGLGLIPDNMGGDTPFVQTSAATGKGIDQLLDMLSLVAELKELKANPNKLGRGTCLEATISEGEGVFATLLVRDGTLHRGDVVLCGGAYGRVRALYDDLGRHIESAGPSVPARITGLDAIPNADDPFTVVDDLSRARDIAEKRRQKQEAAALPTRGPMTLDKLSEIKVAELKVILKADVRGSVEAIRKELEKLRHEEVRVRVLHTGIGAINESDVTLALTSPQDTIIVGFNVTSDDRALALAEERGVQINEYQIIYKLTDDIRSALEGKLKPREEVVHLGRAVVREVFKISRVGTIAGCYVTQGTLERSALVRVIRGGVVIYPPAERTASLESLKRFKDDAREVHQGFECGLKVAGYDDVKVDDVIEAYRIQKVLRTLS